MLHLLACCELILNHYADYGLTDYGLTDYGLLGARLTRPQVVMG